MKKFTKITLITAVCLLCVGIVFASVGRLTGASIHEALGVRMWDTTFHIDYNYHNKLHSDNTYTVKNPQNIQSIDVDWVCGDITIVPYDGNAIVMEETADQPLDEDTCLRYRIKRGALHIQSSRDSTGVSFSGDNGDLAKELTIKVPLSMAAHWEEISVDTVSSDISMEGFSVYSLNIASTSGTFYGKDLTVREVDMATVSGSMEADFLYCPDEFSFESTSGNCMLGLPEDSDTAIEYDTISGRIYNHFEKHKNGKGYGGHHDEGEFLIGHGERACAYFETISGDVHIYQGSCLKKNR